MNYFLALEVRKAKIRALQKAITSYDMWQKKCLLEPPKQLNYYMLQSWAHWRKEILHEIINNPF